MLPTSVKSADVVFESVRPQLMRVAYRMLGSVADAEDVIQDAFLRWLDVDQAVVREPLAYLRRIVARLALDRLKAVRRRREVYIGPWLPEPMIEPREADPEDVTLPLLMALERLSPLERAAFLLHDVFGLSFEEVSFALDRAPAACRQLASRARIHIRSARRRYALPAEQGLEMAEAFFLASRSGNLSKLRAMLLADVVLYADGGGKAPALRSPATGVSAVIPLFESFARVYAKSQSRLLRYAFINGLPGFISVERGGIVQSTALEVAAAGIQTIYVLRNPDKLQHVL
jgi:RNA polymerase sigma-70 factor (ECF subfamily)